MSTTTHMASKTKSKHYPVFTEKSFPTLQKRNLLCVVCSLTLQVTCEKVRIVLNRILGFGKGEGVYIMAQSSIPNIYALIPAFYHCIVGTGDPFQYRSSSPRSSFSIRSFTHLTLPGLHKFNNGYQDPMRGGQWHTHRKACLIVCLNLKKGGLHVFHESSRTNIRSCSTLFPKKNMCFPGMEEKGTPSGPAQNSLLCLEVTPLDSLGAVP